MPNSVGRTCSGPIDVAFPGGRVDFIEILKPGQGPLRQEFTECKNWIGEWTDPSDGGFRRPDGIVYSECNNSDIYSYKMPDLRLHEGFPT
jgi:hypothetical protein